MDRVGNLVILNTQDARIRLFANIIQPMSFRFENLEIWQSSIQLSKIFDEFANRAVDRRMFRYAEQLRGASLSVSNNIAEGSGCFSKKEFIRFLGYARRSVFEIVNTLHAYEQNKLISQAERLKHYPDLLKLSRQISNFMKSLE